MNTLDIYKDLYYIRTSEEVVADYYFKNKIFSFVHFYIGQESVALGVCKNLSKADRVFGNHRSHGHYLAKGGDLVAMYAEMLGRSGGCCKGKGGSMHMLDRSVGFMGSTPILASAVPIAAGSALNQKLEKSLNITAVFYGDGASEEGIVYETMNLAATFNIPLLMVMEDNLYSVCTPQEDRRGPNYNLQMIAEGFGVKFIRADGNDFLDVYKNSKNAVEYIKSNGGPCILACRVYRHMAHSAPIKDDKSGYRKIDTEEVRVKEDSVLRMRRLAVQEFGEQIVNNVEAEVTKIVNHSLEEAVNSSMPQESQMLTSVYHE